MKQLTIGRQSAGFLSRGHPWVRKIALPVALNTVAAAMS